MILVVIFIQKSVSEFGKNFFDRISLFSVKKDIYIGHGTEVGSRIFSFHKISFERNIFDFILVKSLENFLGFIGNIAVNENLSR